MKHYYLADRSDLVGFFNSDDRFQASLDIGCASGELGRALLGANIIAACDGIEMNPEAATEASHHLRKVWNGTLENVCHEVNWSEYDLIMMADVLEHLVDYSSTLSYLYNACRPGSQLVLSVPNVRHYSVVIPLLFKGKFEYQDSGIMDRTHLHFFTRSSLLKAVEASGWKVSQVQPNIKKKYLKWWYPHRLLEEFIAVQYFVMATK